MLAKISGTYFLLLFFYLNAAAQKPVADSLYRAAFTAKHDTIRVQKLLDIAFAHKNARDSAKFYANQALSISEKIGFTNGIGLAYIELSFASNLNEAEIYLFKAAEIFQKSQNLKEYADAMRYLADNQKNQGKYDEALKNTTEALKIAQKINDRRVITICYNTYGIIYRSLGEYDKAIENYYKSLKISEEDKNHYNTSIAYKNIGNVYYYQKNYVKAIEYYEKSVEIKKRDKDERGLILTYSNIGECHAQLKNFDKALLFGEEALLLAEKLKHKNSILSAYRTLGHAHISLKNFDKSHEILQKAIEISRSEKLTERELIFLLLFADYYYEKGEYAQAFTASGEALTLAQKLKNRESLKEAYEKRSLAAEKINNLAEAYFMFKSYIAVRDSLQNESNYKAALSKEFSYKSEKQQLEQEKKELAYKSELALLQRDKEIANLAAKDKERQLEIMAKTAEAERLEELARAEKDKRKADSLTNLAQKNRLEAENLQIQKEKQDLAFKAEREEQKRLEYTYLGIAGTFLIILVLIGIGFRQKQKANEKLAAQNAEIRTQQLEIAEKNDFLNQANEELKQNQEELIVLNENLESQKQTIETTYHQLKHTTEQLDKSIHYASHIQSVVMPEEKDLRNFFSDLFILFRPRDVVSGDFYWFSQISENHAVFSLADCTGHGVPGAFMSMLGSTLLHETVNIKKITDDPARILKNVHHAIRKILKQEQKKNNDGMDISLCVFKKNPETQTVEFIFSGAKSTMSYISNGEIYDLKGDKQYLGGEEMQHDFTNQLLVLPEKTSFYLYSDGFIKTKTIRNAKDLAAKASKPNCSHLRICLSMSKKAALKKSLTIFKTARSSATTFQ